MINLGLSRITKLLASTAIPWKAIHIAGTNGKGSVSNFISSLLHTSGLSVGRFNSPHLVHRWDCITINQQPVSKNAFIGVERLVKARNEAERIDASEFEVLTATAFEIFTRAEVDIGVIECGLGGRLDATNVLKPDQVLCSVFTKIGMDHEALLGDTVLKIAKEKAGIMRKGVPFVADQSNRLEVLMVLDEQAEEVGATQGTFMLPAMMRKQLTLTSQDIHYRGGSDMMKRNPGVETKESGPKVGVSLWPLHQQQNLKTALLACHTIQSDLRVVQKFGRPIKIIGPHDTLGADHMSAVLLLDWPGRLQLINTRCITGVEEAMLLDGAHNKQAAQALSSHVDKIYRPYCSVVWVIALTKGKNIREFISTLFRDGDEIVVTQFGSVDGMPWVESEDLTKLAQAIRSVTRVDVYMESEPWYALRRASQLAAGESAMIICGSLYLAGDVLGMLNWHPQTTEGPMWDGWVDEMRKRLELRRQGIFEFDRGGPARKGLSSGDEYVRILGK